MASQLKDKVVIVTGSSAGLGESIALFLASLGANITFCGRDKDRLKSVLDKAVSVSGGNHNRFLAVAGDLNDRKVREEIIEKTVKKFGSLDVLVANAGILGKANSLMDDTEDTFSSVLDTNLKSVYFLIQKAVPHLEKSKGNIVNISSIVSTMTLQFAVAYSLSKAALDHLTRCLSVDLGPKGIRVNSVNPGYFPTQILRNFEDPSKVNEQFTKSQEVQQSLKGRPGVAEDVAQAVAFLASDAAGFITGEHIKVDGGRSYNGTMEPLVDKKL